ncbi:alpha/beta hydrolase-fold protein [Seonamhaeicola marinus]|uniref:PA14 domain-containing protein n=1 Tax=Seonamhaeicola marinus TaxID=1912246 RepID=A0A5D0JCS1_9FLAO|nr:alpha/beta hydrolase-fold protein [Seonamhaeicola marinus]TYA92367.1 hypothetical protein FUA24_02730 [Seonamhaeicola marinus]
MTLKSNTWYPIKFLAIIVCFFSCSNDLPARSNDLLPVQEMPGESFTISSEFMKEDRKIQVALPKGYNEWTEYNVQYMLDPVWNMELRKSLLDFMQKNAMCPKTILVGIVSPDRNSDMTPTKWDGIATSGNADNFIDFITKEVKPFIEKKYKTTGHNTFAGHSFGGLCVMYSFLKSPDSFDAYLIGDPSLWYDDELLVKMAKEKLPKIDSGKTLFIAGRKGNAFKAMGIDAMEEALKENAHESLDWKVVAYEDESHNSIIYKLNYDGIKFISDDYRNSLIKLRPNQGEVVPNVPLEISVSREDKDNIRYTTDGTEPNFSSPLFNEKITISEPATVKIKVPTTRSNALPAVSGLFVKGEKYKGIKNSNKFKEGLSYKYYEAELKQLPDFKTLDVKEVGVVTEQGFGLGTFPRREKFACVYEGFIEAKTEGYHHFINSSDDGFKFYLHDKLIISNDWRHTAYDIKSTVVYLKKGLHPIKFEYFQYKGNLVINLFAKFPEKEGVSRIDFSRFYHKTNDI